MAQRTQHHRHQNLHAARQQARTNANGPSNLLQWPRALEKPLARLSALTKRADSSQCTANDTSQTCGKPVSGNSLSLPVALGVIVPIAFAVILFLVLHRRHVRRLRREDMNDPHKSLDFGWDPTAQSKAGKKSLRKNKKDPEMTVADLYPEKRPGHTRGLSMDIDIGSPYVLPPAVHGSQESLHSLSRNISGGDDRYRPVTAHPSNDAASIKSHGTRRTRMDDGSSVTGSSTRYGPRDEMKQDLLSNAQRMSRSVPPVDRIPDVPSIRAPEPVKDITRKAVPAGADPHADAAPSLGLPSFDTRDSYVAGDEGGLRRSNTYLGKFIHSGNSTSNLLEQTSNQPSSTPGLVQPQTAELETTKELPSIPLSTEHSIKRKSPPSAINTEASQQQANLPARHQSLYASAHASIENTSDNAFDLGSNFRVDPPSPTDGQHAHNGMYDQEYDYPVEGDGGLAVDDTALGYDVRRLSMGVRPLPPDDPTDNPEQRANRIRSFYKEYFDDSKPVPGGYYEDYDENYIEGATYFDPISGQYITTGPAQSREEPYGRRAMTPPPRNWGGRPHANTLSGSRPPPGPRAFSSASGRFGPSGRGPPKKQLPPPGPLRVLPTPHMLKEDAFTLPIDFAPATNARQRRRGTPDSPRGGVRPYSPSVPAHMPLASSFDDLPSMPSPHLLRKSGTFTALDFALPPRIKGSDDGRSDDGRSIRSNRSAMSARQQHALRAGAYRVSRIPKEMVGTKQDLASALKPQWNMHNNDSRVGMKHDSSVLI